MARIIYTLGELAGSVGGNTFQRNASGTIVRSRPFVSKSSTFKQQQAHAGLQDLLYEWQQLTSDQRDAWNTFAAAHDKVNKFGQEKTLTGANWFTSLNYMRALADEGFLNDPPAYEIASEAPAFDIIATSSTLSLDITGDIDWDTMSLIVWTSLPTTRQKPTINQIRKYVLVKNEDPAGVLDITAEWSVATGQAWDPVNQFPASNVFICVEVINKSSGITSPLLCTSINTSSLEILDPDYLAYIAEFDTPPSEERAALLNQLFVDLKAADIFQNIDRLWLFSSEEQQQGNLSLKNPSSAPVDPINSPSWSTSGYTGNGTDQYLDSNYNPSTDADMLSQNDASAGVWLLSNAATTKYDIGYSNAGVTNDLLIAARYTGDLLYYMCQGNGQVSTAMADSSGYTAVVRSGATAQAAYKDGTQVASTSDSSTSLLNLNIFILCLNLNGTPILHSARPCAFACIGNSQFDQSAFFDIMEQYLTDIGVI